MNPARNVGLCVLCLFLVTMLGENNASVLQLDLTGTWTVSNSARGISVPGQVPGSMYTALMNSKVIEDPYYRDNDVKLAWVAHENWTYTRSFEVTSDMVQSQSILLVAESIDTVSTLFINGQQVATTNNMFIKYTWDVKSFIKQGTNSIRLEFQSATEYAAKQAASYPYTVPPVCPPPEYHGECHVNFIRKTPCSFAWDWGPSFPTQGVWLPIYLEAFNSAEIDLATVEVVPDSSGQGWTLRTKTYFNVRSGQSVTGQLKITLAVNKGLSEEHTVTLSHSSNVAAFDINVPRSANVKRWWPNGYGNQTLYDVIFVFTTSDGEMTSQTKRIGFRTVELVQDPVSSDPKQGLTFYFRVNGFPIFMKGINWIPADGFLERVTKDKVRSLLQSAADAHMNLLIAAGLGTYETEDFYDVTDELGIMVVRGLQFCDALYPTNQAFLDNIEREVTYQLRRLMHRPSIILWTGNDENEVALNSQWYDKHNAKRYDDDYLKLYISILMPIVKREIPSALYLTSTPSNGDQSIKVGYIKEDAQSEYYGDTHFYDYVSDLWVPDKLPVPRFVTEFGLQAWCHYDTLVSVFEQADMAYNSSQAVHRNHHPDGVSQIELQIARHLNFPSTSTPEPERFGRVIYLTQINQAMTLKSEAEHYRRFQNLLLPDGRGLTMGAVYWQLNDIWQAPTWASIDYSGRWKMLHYYATNFFKPVIVSPYLNGSDVIIYVVVDQIPTVDVRDSDTQRLRFEPMTKVEDIMKSSVESEDALDLASKVERATMGQLTVEIYSWNSFKPLSTSTVLYRLNTTAEAVWRQNVKSMITDAGCLSPKDCFIYTYLNKPTDGINNWIYLAELKDSNIPRANVTIASVQQASSPRGFTITLTTDAIAPFVWLEAGSMMGRFSDNGFLLVKMTFTVTFTAWRDDVDIHTLRSHLSVRSLMDVYK
ncbi:beta-mannosidase-like [Littorina saxatilis]|uniref:beta-mannosidase n=1 Tax=Littorina saxatilis TaxID=31220 RepID=A0AAN9BQI1_9CAEN